MEDKQQEKNKKKIVFYLIPILIFVGFISYMTIRTYTGEVKAAVTETTLSVDGFENLSDSFEEVLQENMYDKNEYINLNGLTTRVLGINSLNRRQKLTNGFLTEFRDETDPAVNAASVIELNSFLNERGIDFIYLLAPHKLAFYDAEVSLGYSNPAKQDFNEMIDILDAANVTTINMNAWYEENGWSMEDVYYKTDHHWTPNGALAAAKETMEVLVEQNIIDDYDSDLLEEDSYTIVTKENWFLGSEGKRVGMYYAGLDDLNVYFPNFSTDYKFARLTKGTTDWHYDDSPLDLQYLEAEEPDYYGTDPNCTYLYGSEPLQICINNDARNDKIVLLIGDSFKRTWEYFLSTQFQKIYSIDNRDSNYTDGSIVQFIEEIQPDIVIMCSSTISSEIYYSFGTEDYLAALDATSIQGDAKENVLSEITVEAQENNNRNFTVLFDNLKPNQTYTLTLDSTAYSGGEDMFVQMTLQDISNNTPIYNRYFDANSDETQKWIFTVPGGTDTYAIYLYAGTKGHTENVSVDVTNITLNEGVLED